LETIEGKFWQGKNGYRLNYIRARRADTSAAWINGIFLVMNLLIPLRIFFVPGKKALAERLLPGLRTHKWLICHWQRDPIDRRLLSQIPAR